MGLIVLCVVVIALGGAFHHFFTVDNGFTILLNITAIGIATFGSGLLIISGNVDLSIGGMYGLTRSDGDGRARHPEPGPRDRLRDRMGAVLGLFNGRLVRALSDQPADRDPGDGRRLPGLAFVVTDARSIFGFPEAFVAIGRAEIGPVPLPVIIGALVFLVGGFILLRTVVGLRIYAVGGNIHRPAGRRPDRAGWSPTCRHQRRADRPRRGPDDRPPGQRLAAHRHPVRARRPDRGHPRRRGVRGRRRAPAGAAVRRHHDRRHQRGDHLRGRAGLLAADRQGRRADPGARRGPVRRAPAREGAPGRGGERVGHEMRRPVAERPPDPPERPGRAARRCSRATTSRSRTARSRPSAASRSRWRPARSSASWATTAPARAPSSRCSAAPSSPTRERSRSAASR